MRVENSSAIEVTVVAFGSGQVPGKSIGVVVQGPNPGAVSGSLPGSGWYWSVAVCIVVCKWDLLHQQIPSIRSNKAFGKVSTASSLLQVTIRTEA